MPDQDWQKSSFSCSSDACVEVRTVDGLIEVRESDDSDIILHTTAATFADLLHTIKAGELDHHA
ncbi:DUF397 domain-containing protein [Kitasatospora misakiensis]|uniref:DUF397 domain-containing protein n=1 Tax=Kitasatospora misakiensis TaxID=67330 RepID=A0ABW0XDC5_9ACTN